MGNCCGSEEVDVQGSLVMVLNVAVKHAWQLVQCRYSVIAVECVVVVGITAGLYLSSVGMRMWARL